MLLVIPPFEFSSSSSRGGTKDARRREQLGGVGGEGENEEEEEEGAGSDEDDEDEEGDEGSRNYCDEPSCGRNFPHTHVGGGSSGATSLVGRGEAKGSEALAKEEMTRV